MGWPDMLAFSIFTFIKRNIYDFEIPSLSEFDVDM